MSTLNRTRIPVSLPEALKEEWRAYALGPYKTPGDLVNDLTEEGKKPPTSQVSRFINGDGATICSWLEPKSSLGRAFLQRREVSPEQVIGWLEARLHPETAPRFGEDLLRCLPLHPKERSSGESDNDDALKQSSDPLALAVQRLRGEEGGELRPISWEDLKSWVEVLRRQEQLQSEEFDQALKHLSTRSGVVPIAGSNPHLLLVLLEDLLESDLETDVAALRHRAARAILSGLERDAQDVLISVERHFVPWLARAGSWCAPLPREAVMEVMRCKTKHVDPAVLWDLVGAANDSDPERRRERVQACLKEFNGTHLDRLMRNGVLAETHGEYWLTPAAQDYAAQVAPHHLECADAASVAAHPDGRRLICDAIACAPASKLNDWAEVACSTDQAAQPYLAIAVLQGLAARKEPHPTIECVWATALWMYLLGFGDDGPARWGFSTLGLGEIMDATRELREFLPVLDGESPLDDLRAKVPPPILKMCAAWVNPEESLDGLENTLGLIVPYHVPFWSAAMGPIQTGHDLNDVIVNLYRVYRVEYSADSQDGGSYPYPYDFREKVVWFQALRGDERARREVIKDYWHDNVGPRILHWVGDLCEVEDAERLARFGLEKALKNDSTTAADGECDDSVSWRAALVCLLRRKPELLPDGILIWAGWDRLCSDNDYSLYEMRVEMCRGNGRLLSSLTSAPISFLVKLARELGREGVLRQWSCPPAEVTASAVRHHLVQEYDQRSGSSISLIDTALGRTLRSLGLTFPDLAVLSELRHAALIALDDTELLRSGQWVVEDEKLGRAYRALIFLSWTKDCFHGEPALIEDRYWYPIVRSILGLSEGEPSGPIDLESREGLKILAKLNRFRDADRLALLTVLPTHRAIALWPFFQWLFERCERPVIRAFLDEKGVTIPRENLWYEDEKYSRERERFLLIKEDPQTQEAWLMKRSLMDESDHFPIVKDLLEDLTVAHAVWPRMGQHARGEMLRQLKNDDGPLDSVWMRRARERLSRTEYLALCRKRGTPKQLANAQAVIDAEKRLDESLSLRLDDCLDSAGQDEMLTVLSESLDSENVPTSQTAKKLDEILLHQTLKHGTTTCWEPHTQSRVRELCLQTVRRTSLWTDRSLEPNFRDWVDFLRPDWQDDPDLRAFLNTRAVQLGVKKGPVAVSIDDVYQQWKEAPHDMTVNLVIARATEVERERFVRRAMTEDSLTMEHLWSLVSRILRATPDLIEGFVARVKERATDRELLFLLHDATTSDTPEWTKLRVALQRIQSLQIRAADGVTG